MAWRKTRLASVDCMRGLAMAGMLLANNPGDKLHVYRQLRHAAWNGWTAADFVFPLFLFLVGVCVPLAVDRDAVRAGTAKHFWSRTLRRTVVLFGLGLLENAYLALSFDHLRIPGVLQRIAVVYLAAVWLYVRLPSRAVAAVAAFVLAGYWALLTFVPVPGLGHPSLDRLANLEGWLDQLLLGGHIWRYNTSWDPEGVLSTFPAIALGLAGVLAGEWLRSGAPGPGRVFAMGLAMHVAGLAWNPWFPINKTLCTSSFVLFVGGFGVMSLAACRQLMDVGGRTAWATPLTVLGKNPLAIYVAASFLASTLRHVKIPDASGGTVSLQAALFHGMTGSWTDASLASLAWAVCFLLVMLAGAWLLHARRIVIKI